VRRAGAGKRTGKAALEPQSDREGALAALRRLLESGNAAAVVAAGKTLIELDRTEERERLWQEAWAASS
jgi:hypothetical protein